MTDWHPRDHMGPLAYLWFKLGRWAEVDTVPEWVQQASDPPGKYQISVDGSVDAVFTGDNLQYKIVTKRVNVHNWSARDTRGPGPGTKTEQQFYIRIKR